MQRLKTSTTKHTESNPNKVQRKTWLHFSSQPELPPTQGEGATGRSRIQDPNVQFYWTWRDAAHPFTTVCRPRPRPCPLPAPTLAKNALLPPWGASQTLPFQWQLRLGLKEITSPLDSPAPSLLLCLWKFNQHQN